MLVKKLSLIVVAMVLSTVVAAQCYNHRVSNVPVVGALYSSRGLTFEAGIGRGRSMFTASVMHGSIGTTVSTAVQRRLFNNNNIYGGVIVGVNLSPTDEMNILFGVKGTVFLLAGLAVTANIQYNIYNDDVIPSVGASIIIN